MGRVSGTLPAVLVREFAKGIRLKRFFTIRPRTLFQGAAINGIAFFSLLLTIATTTSCTGVISGGDGTGHNDSRGSGNLNPTGNGSASGSGVVDPNAAGPLPFRGLTREEYNFTVLDLLNDASAPGGSFDADPNGGSGFEDPGIPSLSTVQAWSAAAEKVAATASQNSAALVGCDTQSAGEDGCFDGWLPAFVQRAYRRPIRAEESKGLSALYAIAKTTLGYGFSDRIRVVLTAILQSPNFLDHWEIDGGPASGDKPVPLDSYALASRLSYFIYRSLPDADLFEAARSGRLKTADDVERETRRMLADPKAKRGVESFYVQWLGIRQLPTVQRDPTAFPNWTPTLFGSAVAETKAFVDDAVLVDGQLTTLFNATSSFINQDLATIYGISNVTGPELRKMPLPSDQRRGILTQVAFLSMYPAGSNTHPPVRRGQFINNRVACGSISPPGMVPALEPPPPGLPLRQHFEAHSKLPQCAACHKVLDPLGFVFENYDSVGTYRTVDSQGQPVDPTGSVALPDQDTLTFNNALDFTTKIGASSDVQACQPLEWLEFALARHESDADAASLAQARAALAESGDLREALVAIAVSKTFTNRLPGIGEDSP